jgi:hypothetical protein
VAENIPFKNYLISHKETMGSEPLLLSKIGFFGEIQVFHPLS